MKKFLAGLSLVLMLSACSFKSAAQEEAVWEDACVLYSVSLKEIADVDTDVCEDIVRPEVRYYVDPEDSRWGYYAGTSYVYVKRHLKGLDKLSTLFHEYIHYIDKMKLGVRVPGDAYEMCYGEARAYYLEDLWYELQGVETPQNPNWLQYYPQCIPVFRGGME